MKSKIIWIVILITALIASAAEQNEWTEYEGSPKLKVGMDLVPNICDLVWNGEEVFFIGKGGKRFNPKTNEWKAMAKCPLPIGKRSFFSAMWTGSEIIVWGAKYGLAMSIENSGARYDPEKDKWKPMAAFPFEPRILKDIVWTGKKLIVWGGSGEGMKAKGKNDGAVYDPKTDSWKKIADAPFLSGRASHSSTWTGKEMIVFGGIETKSTFDLETLADGGRYDPETDSWKKMAKSPFERTKVKISALTQIGLHNAFWAGNKLVILNQKEGDEKFETHWDGASYDPESDTWNSISLPDIEPRINCAVLWTGEEVILWGGVFFRFSPVGGSKTTFYFNGAKYNPEEDNWTSVPHYREPKAIAMNMFTQMAGPIMLVEMKKSTQMAFITSNAVWTGEEIITYNWRYRQQ